MSGPPPTPTELKRRRGNPGKRRLPTGEPTPPPLLHPADPPAHLTEAAAAVWRAEAARLPLALTVADCLVFEVLCETVAYYRAIVVDLAEAGDTQEMAGQGRIARPAVVRRKELVAQLLTLANHFGLSPAARVRLAAPPPAKPESKWAGLLSF